MNYRFDDKSSFSVAQFLRDDILAQCLYTVGFSYADNGTEYKRTKEHVFVQVCTARHINQKFTLTGSPQTYGKAQRGIRTLIQMWHEKEIFEDRQDRKSKLKRFLNYYNTVKPHQGLKAATPYEILDIYFIKICKQYVEI